MAFKIPSFVFTPVSWVTALKVPIAARTPTADIERRMVFSTAVMALCMWAACAQAADSQQHWVRGTVMRVSESAETAGGPENNARGAAHPRVSGDGNKVVFYSDAAFSSEGFEADNEFHIWM